MFTEKIASLWDQLKVVFSDFAFTDFLDICLVAFILYSVIKLIRETKAIQLAKGLLLFRCGLSCHLPARYAGE